ncbi:MAG: TonB-dependent receptor plug domain-containing protein [Bacteroidia bacterium]|nr:TonB-dependent receptor plug domain-containing protein [Bacteroidia bacterium]
MRRTFLITIFTFSMSAVFCQVSLQGIVKDTETGEPLAGVNITVENKLAGTVTDARGRFVLTTNETLPVTLVFSFVGFEKQWRTISNKDQEIEVLMSEQVLLGQEVVVSASRVEENILKSPVSIEKMGLLDIQQSPAPNFFDGLYNLKGVDMSVHGLLFKLPNTRGFNGNTNYRINQLIDGVDNTPPGLSYAAGNIFGLSQLDVESVELLVGASSALYGPGGMNGTILMTSKNPFDYQGLSVSAQLGVMHVGADYRDTPAPYGEFNLRWAKVLNKKWAVKATAGYIAAEDWHGADYRDRTDFANSSLTRKSNPGYDGVNTYGDDIIVPVNLKDVAPSVADGVATSQGYTPGTPEYEDLYNMVIALMPDQVVSRTGWKEEDLVDYNTSNLKLGASVHHRINENLEAIFQAAYSNGTSVYTAQNRFSLRGFSIYSGKLEIKSQDFYVRTYGLSENSGNTYDAGATGLLMNEAWKPSEVWYQDYIASFTQTRLLGGNEAEAHRFARLVADNRNDGGGVFADGKPALPMPGTDEFNELLDDIRLRPVNDGGSKVTDKSKMWHIEGLYNFSRKIKWMEWIIGASHRIYSINSEGTIFFDEPGEPIVMNQFGAFTQLSKKVLRDRVKVTTSARYDKNEYFKGRLRRGFHLCTRSMPMAITMCEVPTRPHSVFRPSPISGSICSRAVTR